MLSRTEKIQVDYNTLSIQDPKEKATKADQDYAE